MPVSLKHFIQIANDKYCFGQAVTQPQTQEPMGQLYLESKQDYHQVHQYQVGPKVVGNQLILQS